MEYLILAGTIAFCSLSFFPKTLMEARATELCEEGWSSTLTSWKNNTGKDLTVLVDYIGIKEYWTVPAGKTIANSMIEFRICRNFAGAPN